jgi:hypothetical protein
MLQRHIETEELLTEVTGKQWLINLYNYITTQFPDKGDSYILKETCKATRIKQTTFI